MRAANGADRISTASRTQPGEGRAVDPSSDGSTNNLLYVDGGPSARKRLTCVGSVVKYFELHH